MMKLWERNVAPSPVDGVSGAGTRPYLVLCHRPPEDAAALGQGDAPTGHDVGDAGNEEVEDLDLDGGGGHRTATVYQWVQIPR